MKVSVVVIVLTPRFSTISRTTSRHTVGLELSDSGKRERRWELQGMIAEQGMIDVEGGSEIEIRLVVVQMAGDVKIVGTGEMAESALYGPVNAL